MNNTKKKKKKIAHINGISFLENKIVVKIKLKEKEIDTSAINNYMVELMSRDKKLVSRYEAKVV